MNQLYTPLIEAIQAHIKQHPTSFHVPGHKNGMLFPDMLYQDFQHVLPYDVTELEGLDDLHDPSGPIQEAQQLAARFYGAKHTFFLVGGSTVGNLAMVYSLCKPGDTVLVQRNAHKSVFHAIKLARVKPIFLSPEYDKETGHAIGLTVDTVREALSYYPKAKALLMTYPNYYGVGINPIELITVAKEAGLLVLVDEAHGAHFHISNSFPPSTLTLGADAVVQSTHKMLPALTMGSYLHVHQRLLDKNILRIQNALRIFQSSSPSYLIMASLDGARAYAEMIDQQKINQIMAGVLTFKHELASIEQIEIVNWKDKPYHCDPLKVTIKSLSELSGYQLQNVFEQVGLFAEMADDTHVLLVLGLGVLPKIEMIKKLKLALSVYSIKENKKRIPFKTELITSLEIAFEDVDRYPRRKVSLDDAVGKIASEAIIPYPPGIPVILPGEKITKEKVEQLKGLEKVGARFQGFQSSEGMFVVEVEEEE